MESEISSESFRKDTNLDFLDKQIDTEHGLTSRIVSTFERHWGDRNLPVIHITNDETNWGPGSPIISTGFIESIKTTGLRNFTNVGFIPPSSMDLEIINRFSKRPIDTSHITEEEARKSPQKFLIALDRIRQEFIHHGLRTNKNKVMGKLSIPAIIIIDGNVYKQAGDDSPIHAQLNEPIKPKQIISVFQFDPKGIIRNYMERGDNPPISEKSKSKNTIPFKEELSNKNLINRKEFTRQIIKNLALFRLHELKALSEVTQNINLKEKIILAAHDLVDIYAITPNDFDKEFPNVSIQNQVEINRHRKNFLFSNH